ncbi:hypothetical protein [Photobacterium damselae]|uniref:hypothetical protein n=1 Tax=Photobacterium damselae TaxID=38293 RepID=UPI002113B406|nr:hypothetical protein [Photobacterium damselae]
MDVIKRDGRKEKASLDKVTRRAEMLADGLKVRTDCGCTTRCKRFCTMALR